MSLLALRPALALARPPRAVPHGAPPPRPAAAAPRRPLQTHSLPPAAARDILNAQRLRRPSSPHFTIYQPQLTWFASIANRCAGASLSLLFYGGALTYVAVPALGVPVDSAQLVALVHALPDSAKYAAKLLLAAPFAFHSWNGLRHLLWDSGRFLSVRAVYATGYTVLALTAATTAGLLLL